MKPGEVVPSWLQFACSSVDDPAACIYMTPYIPTPGPKNAAGAPPVHRRSALKHPSHAAAGAWRPPGRREAMESERQGSHTSWCLMSRMMSKFLPLMASSSYLWRSLHMPPDQPPHAPDAPHIRREITHMAAHRQVMTHRDLDICCVNYPRNRNNIVAMIAAR